MQFVFPQQKQVASQIHKTLQVFAESQGEIRPHFHLTGPSGSGKTHLLKTLAEDLKLPMIELNAAQPSMGVLAKE